MKYLKNLIFWLSLFQFLLHFRCQDSIESFVHYCNSTAEANQGIFLSPSFPRPYPPNSFCKWLITAEEGRTILMYFIFFEVENNPGCAYDRVEVYNGPSTDYSLMGKFCGPHLPPDSVSTSNTMLVTFQSDGSTEKRGFRALFVAEELEVAEPNSCGGLMTAESGSFHSINFPNSNYPSGVTCVWHLRAPNNYQVVLTFSKLTVEYSSKCKYDSVTVHSGTSPKARLTFHGKFCKISDVPNQIVSDGNEMFVTFATDSSGNDVGFLASYTTKPGLIAVTSDAQEITKPQAFTSPPRTFCLETTVLTSSSGWIMSPGYKNPEGYAPDLNCSWRIESSPETKIALRFENFFLEEDDECLFDYVLAYSGRDEHGEQLGRYCGIMENVNILSEENYMFIVFVSDYGRQNAGFRAFYSSVQVTSEAETSSMQIRVSEAITSQQATVETTTSLQTTKVSILSSRIDSDFTTNSLAFACQDSCLQAQSISNVVCASEFVALMKILNVDELSSGISRVRTSLIKMYKLEINGVPKKKKSIFVLYILCPTCHPRLVRKQRYIFAGTNMSNLTGRIEPENYIQNYSKVLKKAIRRSVKQC